jgi:phosphatidylserine/phosphatidylglycerophosphate/cardiolipin synthase-like enzyme
VAAIDVFTLTDGGQRAEEVAQRAAAFVAEARETLDLALYDIRLPGAPGDLVSAALHEAAGRGVAMRLLYNVDSARPAELHPPPQTRPDILAELPIDARPVPGIPDLMHHKYAVRDGSAVWTGSANWTVDSWTRQENVLAVVGAEAVARAYRGNFEELWERRDVERSGRAEPELTDAGGTPMRAWFTPGQGQDLSQAIATAIGRARRRVRIASPVITSGPVLATLAEIGAERENGGGGIDIAGVVDEPQTDTVFQQWRDNGTSAWKIPLLAMALERLPFSGKRSTPWTPDSVHDFMHAKVTIADDVVFMGSFNLSRSGERNAENVLEVRDAELADRMAAFVDQVRERYPRTSIPEQARATISSGSSATSAISKSAGEIRPSPSSRSRIQASSPDQ